MKTICDTLVDLGWSRHAVGDRLLVDLPNSEKLEVIAYGNNPTLHISLPPLAAARLNQSFDMTPTLVGDYLVDEETLCRMFMLLAEQFEPIEKRRVRKDVADFAKELTTMTSTEQKSEAVQRRGQNKLRAYLLERYGGCQISGVKENELLVASHIKPWACCKDGPDERLDPENVLLLASNWDALFDRFYISFDPGTGAMLKSPCIHSDLLRCFGVPSDWPEQTRIPVETARRRSYLEFHRRRMEERSKL